MRFRQSGFGTKRAKWRLPANLDQHASYAGKFFVPLNHIPRKFDTRGCGRRRNIALTDKEAEFGVGQIANRRFDSSL